MFEVGCQSFYEVYFMYIEKPKNIAFMHRPGLDIEAEL